MSWLPADVANQALDQSGVDFTLGDLEEGSKPAQVVLRQYGICLRQLLRAAHWQFARAQLPLTLLADASGQTPNVGSLVPIPWNFSYRYPDDCMLLRFIPWNYGQNIPLVPTGNIAIPNTPLTTAATLSPFLNQRLRPSRFLVGIDPNFPSPPGSNFAQSQGQSPAGSTVIMSNVQQAIAIYTRFMPYPNTWDVLFRGAFVAYLASEIAMPLNKDKKLAMALRKDNIEIAKAKIKEARVMDGNEAWSSSDLAVDWMQTRRGRGWGRSEFGGGFDDGVGCFFNSWSSCGFADGSAF